MSQRDLVAELRGSRIAAPAELREHVRSIAAPAHPRRGSRFTWRRALVVALPAAAAIAAVLVVTRPDNNQTAVSGRVGPGQPCAPEKSLAAPPIAQSGSVGSGATRLAPQSDTGPRAAVRRLPRAARADARRRLRRRQARAAHRVVARRLPDLGARELARRRPRRPT